MNNNTPSRAGAAFRLLLFAIVLLIIWKFWVDFNRPRPMLEQMYRELYPAYSPSPDDGQKRH